MSVIRVNKNANYTVMSNYHLRDKNLSLKAKGLLSLMLSLPDSWDYTVKGLITLSKDGRDSVMNTLTELENNFYLSRIQVVDNCGKFLGYDYEVYELPQTDIPFTVKPMSEKPMSEKPMSENPPQLNNNINNISSYEDNTNIINKEDDINKENGNINITTKEKRKRRTFIPPTEQEVYDYANTRGRGDLARVFYDYYTATDWYDSKGKKVISWKGKFITWEKNNEIPQAHKSNNQGSNEYINEFLQKYDEQPQEYEI